jgi:hypothetical protein
MNLVGKIFVVLILIAATVFMTLGLMVYATHHNWYEEIIGKNGNDAMAWKGKLKAAYDEQVKLRQDIEKLTIARDAEKANHLQALAKSESQINILNQSQATLAADKAKLEGELATATTAVNKQQEMLVALRKENGDIREEIRTAYKQVDEQLKKATQIEDKLHIALGQLTDLKARANQMTLQLANARALLKPYNLTLDSPVNHQPGNVRGEVLAVDKDDRAEVSLGSDDGMLEGGTLEIYRGNRYLGRLQLLEVQPHRSIGVILKEYKQDVIRTGDNVATQLKA